MAKIKLEPITISIPPSASLRSTGRRLRRCIELLSKSTSWANDRDFPVSDLIIVADWLEAVQKVKRSEEIRQRKLELIK